MCGYAGLRRRHKALKDHRRTLGLGGQHVSFAANGPRDQLAAESPAHQTHRGLLAVVEAVRNEVRLGGHVAEKRGCPHAQRQRQGLGACTGVVREKVHRELPTDDLGAVAAQPHQHGGIEALDAVAHVKGVQALHDAAGEKVSVLAVGLDFDDERRGHGSPTVPLEDAQDLAKRGNALVGPVEAVLLELRARKLLDGALLARHALEVGVMDDNQAVVSGEVHVKLHAKAVLAGAPKGGKRVLGGAKGVVVEAAVCIAVARKLVPALVNRLVARTGCHAIHGSSPKTCGNSSSEERRMLANDAVCHRQSSIQASTTPGTPSRRHASRRRTIRALFSRPISSLRGARTAL